jgi:hypothetical protein
VPWPGLSTGELERAWGALTLGDLRDGAGQELRVAEVDTARLECAAALIALTARTYEEADFEAYASLRGADLAFAEATHPGRIDELEGLIAQLPVPGVGPVVERDAHGQRGSLAEALGSFWHGFYRTPPVQRFQLESARVALGREHLDGSQLEEWDARFASLGADLEGAGVDLQPMVPHRRALRELLGLGRTLDWIDLDLPFATAGGGRAHLLARFVWDAAPGEWFLQRASILHTERHDPQLDRAYLIV